MDNQPDEKVTQWAELMGELFDRLTGKGAEITYNFENLEIDIPKAVGPGGQNMGSAKWTINGRLVITAEDSRGRAYGSKTYNIIPSKIIIMMTENLSLSCFYY